MKIINIFQYLQDTKGKPIPLKIKLLYNLPLNESDLIYNGNLNLKSSNKISLPDNLTINGNLYLWFSNLTSLPNNLTVNGYINLENSNITSLPNNLTVNAYLFINRTNISKLPDNLYVNGDLFCINTPLANNIKNDVSLLNKYSKQIKGNIYYDTY